MLIPMFSLLLGLSLAQTKVRDVIILRSGETFINTTDTTFFVLSRFRLERLVTDAQLSDSVKTLWESDVGRMEAEKTFWKVTTYSAIVVSVVEFLILMFK